MSHQPYEEWLFEPDSLTPEQAAELKTHLLDCADCSRLQAGWQGLRQVIRAEDEVQVPAGFTARWQASLPEREARRRAEQIRRLFYLLGGGILLCVLALLALFTVVSTPAELFHRAIQAIAGAHLTLTGARDLLFRLLDAAPTPVLFLAGLASASWLVLISLTWLFAIIRFSMKGVPNQ